MLGRSQSIPWGQRILLYAFLTIVGAVMAYPFFFMVTTLSLIHISEPTRPY